MTQNVKLRLECMGRINGQLMSVDGTGEGRADLGRFALDINFHNRPQGYPIQTSALWTCCSTPSFAIERNGAFNMLTISKGRYRCERTFDFGEYGAYDYNYELRLSTDENDMRATGIIEGSLSLPEMAFAEESFSEIMMPVAENEIRSFISATFISEDGRRIPVKATGKYTPIDGDVEWACSRAVIGQQIPQVRSSFIEKLQTQDSHLALEYTTVVKGLDVPVVSKDEIENAVSKMVAAE